MRLLLDEAPLVPLPDAAGATLRLRVDAGLVRALTALAAADEDDAVKVAAGVFITLLVYWLAERWSELIAAHLRGVEP